MKSRSVLKTNAKEQLFKNKKVYWTFVIIMVICEVILGINIALNDFWKLHLISTILGILISIPVVSGIYFAAYRVREGKLHICSFLSFFRSGFLKYIKIIVLNIIIAILVGIASIFLIVPGIIVVLMYSQAIFIMCHQEVSILKALKMSREMMQGHKWDFFVLHLSFILWYILIFITAGIAGFFIKPYIMTTYANYYNELYLDYVYITHRVVYESVRG